MIGAIYTSIRVVEASDTSAGFKNTIEEQQKTFIRTLV